MENNEKEMLREQVRNVKLRLRGVMNGITSTSMRNKGLVYKVNFGVELPRLREMAEELPHTYSLATELWKEDIRECRLLAAMLMPTLEPRFTGLTMTGYVNCSSISETRASSSA